MNLYISPHPDDAILSCGGRLLEDSESGMVLNVFSGSYLQPTSWDQLCEAGSSPMKKRIREDRKILSSIGVRSAKLDFYDYVARKEVKKISFGKKKEEKLKSRIEEFIVNWKPQKVFFPAGISHPDHKILAEIGEDLRNNFKIIFYEDIPYAFNNRFDGDLFYQINKETLIEKVRLILKYKTQLKGFLELSGVKKVFDFEDLLYEHHFKDGRIGEVYGIEKY